MSDDAVEVRQVVKAEVQGKKSDDTFEDIITDDAGRLQVYDPKVFESLVVYEGTATADGPDTSTITDTVLAGKPDYNGQLLCITSGAYDGQTRDIDQPTDEGGGKAHVAKAFDGTIVEGTTYVILSIRPTTAEVADIEAKLDHTTHGLAALKTLLDSILEDTGTTLEAKLDAIGALVDAVKTKLDSPDDFKADVSALALEATLTAIEAKLDHSEHGLEELGNRQLLYNNVLYADANPAVGSDVANDGSRESPFLTIVHAVSVASEYTTIRAVDSRTGAAAAGFDENAAIAGVVINTNYITVIGCKLFGDRCFGKNVPITNSIADADYVFSGSGIGVVVCGFNPILAKVNGDEKCIYLTGDGACAIHCDVSQSAGAHGFIGIHLTGDDVHVRRCHGRWFDDDVVRLEGCVMGHVEESILGAGLNGVHLLTGCLGCVVERCDIIANTVGALIDAGATYNHICMPYFSNNTTDFTNNGDATNDVVDAHKESQISAGQTIEEDLKDIDTEVAGKPNVQDVIIYPAAEDRAGTELDGDGTAPNYLAESSQNHADEAAGMATPAWTEDIDFEQEGTITIISIYAELHWAQKQTGGGTSSVKVQISGDGGSTWVDLTDNVTEDGTAYADKTRAGAGKWIAAITGGANQLQLRLCQWGGTTSSEVKLREDSYLRITYRKS